MVPGQPQHILCLSQVRARPGSCGLKGGVWGQQQACASPQAQMVLIARSSSFLGKQTSSGPTAQFYLVFVFVAISLCLKPLYCGLRLQGLSGVTLARCPASGQECRKNYQGHYHILHPDLSLFHRGSQLLFQEDLDWAREESRDLGESQLGWVSRWCPVAGWGLAGVKAPRLLKYG